MFTEGSIILDTRFNRYGSIEAIEYKSKGFLFRVLFEDGSWGSYYEKTLYSKRFHLAAGSDFETPPSYQATPIDSNNVVYVNFYTGEKFSDRQTWEYFLNMKHG